jgi:DNA polymerase delta subunit 1
MLIEKSKDKAIDFAKQTISDLLQNKCDLSLLVITKSLGKSANAEDYTSKQAHVELAERMRKRDPTTAPVVGDRVAYVITKAAKGAAAYEKAEDPIYVLEHDIPIDVTYYLENQLKMPLTRIFEPIMGDVQKLFAGDHTRSIKLTTPTSAAGGIMKFAVKKRTCLGCKVPLKANEKTVCAHCHENQAELYVAQVSKVRSFEQLYSKTWTQCQRCQGSLHQEVLCTSRDCPIFYRRKKVQKDLKEAQSGLDRFAF